MNIINRLKTFVKQIPLTVWILIIAAFILGFIIRGSGSSESTEATHDHSAEQTASIWTCSMHPQIRLPEPGQCPICFMDLIPLETGSGDSDMPTQLKMSENAVKLAEIQTTQIKRAAATAEILLSGRIEADETRQKTISAWMPGRLERLYVDYTGTSVKKGEHLVDIYSPELYSAQEELIQARQILGSTPANNALSRKGAETNLRAAREKLHLLGLAIEQIITIEKQKEPNDRITIYSPLSGIITGKHANQGEYVQTGTKIYMITDLSQVWVMLDAYESDLFWLRYAQTVNFKIEALPGQTFEGKISFINPILDPKTRTVSVRVNLPNTDGKLKPGMFVRGMVHASLDAKGNSINPQLAGKWISPMHPEIVKDRPGICDICGMPLVRAEELGIVRQPSSKQLPLLVPASAVLKTGKRALVYVKVPNTEEPTYESREIRISARAGDFYIVEEGLSEGEEVVTNGNFKIDSAMQIAAKPSMMSPEGGVSATGHEGHGGAVPKSTIPEMVKLVVDVPVEFREALSPLYDSYLNAQTALAEDNFKQSKTHLTRLGKLVDNFNVNNFKLADDAHHQFLQISKQITDQTKHAKHWRSNEDVRKAFEDISIAVLNMEKQFGHRGDDTFYESYCPMAFNNKGAYWLAKDKQINNPFFGAKILRCSEVKDTFPSKTGSSMEHDSHE